MKLIDADEFVNYLEKYSNRCSESAKDRNNENDILEYLLGVDFAKEEPLEASTIDPLDALGVCRCKDCLCLWHDAQNELFCAIEKLNYPKETDYCPYAKRKEV